MAKREAKIIKKKMVLASGTFDLLHLGHVKYLEEAKKFGGKNAILIVIVAKDKTVEKRKRKKPIIPEEQRRSLVESLKVVDKAILGYEDFDMNKVIDEIEPDVIAVGYDQNNIEERVRKTVEEKGLAIQVVRIKKFGKTELDSSRKIKKKVKQLYR